MTDQRSFLGALLGDGRPLILFTGLCLVLSGLFALFLSATGHFLPHDVQFLGMGAEQLCSLNECRIVHFMFHDRVSFGGALIAIGTLYLWLAEFPLRNGQSWAWWLLAASGVLGFGSFLAYLGYGYLDTWHGAATLALFPCFVLGLWRSYRSLPHPVGPLTLACPGEAVPWRSTFGMGRACLLITSLGLVGGGMVILTVGTTCVFVPQDLAFMGLSADNLRSINPNLVPLIAHDRAGFGGGVCTCGLLMFFCVWCGPVSRSLWQALCFSGAAGFTTAVGIHPLIGYTDFTHLAPAVSGAILFTVGLVLTYRPMMQGVHATEESSDGTVNLASPRFKANPFPYFARLRSETPIARVTLPTRESVWLITRYDDVAAVLKDERFVKNTANAMTPEEAARQPWFRKAFQALKRNLLDLDPPEHTRLRALVQKAFTPRLVEEMRPRIQQLTDELLDKVQMRGSMDLIAEYALPVPTTIIAEMLGIPVEDRHKFHRWSNALTSAASSTWGLVRAVPNVLFFMRYLRKVIKQRRADPRDDLISELTRVEEAGEHMSEDELLAMVFLLLVAGHETTVNLIGNGMLALFENPEQLERLRKEPALIRPAVEELLRYSNPVDMATERYARENVTINGTTIRRGEMLYPVILSANRDERQFPNADRLDITREPNRHLSFGQGAHFCLGASLARLEAQVAINTLLRRLPDLRLAVPPEAIRWRRGLVLRGLEALPVTFGKLGLVSELPGVALAPGMTGATA